MRVLFWGTPAFALPALRALGEEGHDIVGVVTQPDRPAGRGREPRSSAVKDLAIEEMIPVLQPEEPHGPEFTEQIRSLSPDVSVVVAYGCILKPEILDLPPEGSVNIHASLLPALRGAAPVHWAIINGLPSTGVTIMRMDAGLDSGPILYQVEEPIRADESMTELGMRLSEVGAEALIETLTMMETTGVTAEPQDAGAATYAPKVGREMSRVDWTKPAIEIARWIRGLDATPGAWSRLNDALPVKLFGPRVELRQGRPGEVLEVDQEVGVLIAAGHEAVRVRQVQPPGSRRMDAGEWIRGRGVAAGDLFS